MSDGVKPTVDPFRIDDRDLAKENEERGLKGIIDIGRIVENLPAGSKDRFSVPANQGGKRLFITMLAKTVDQLRIRKGSILLESRLAECSSDPIHSRFRHVSPTLKNGLGKIRVDMRGETRCGTRISSHY